MQLLTDFFLFPVSLSTFSDGISAVWTSPVLPKLQSNDASINPLQHGITSYEVALIASLYPVGSILAPFPCSKLIDGIGRKNTLLAMAILQACFFLVLALASNLMWVLIARLVIGFCSGGSFIAASIFLSEVAEDHNRGKMCCILSLFWPLGQLYDYVIGPFFSVKNFTLLCMLPAVMQSLFLLFYIPESPVYLVQTGKRHAAIKSLRRYRSNPTAQKVEEDIETIQYTIERTTNNHKGGLKSLVYHKASRRGFIISLGLFMTKVATGISIIFGFMGPIFEDAQIGISGNITAIIVCSLKISVYFCVTQIVEKLGRKPLILISVTFCSISLFFLGLYFFMKERRYGSYQNYTWLPIVSIFFYIVTFSFGVGPIPSATFGELFASNVRSIAVSTVIFCNKIAVSLSIALYPIVVTYIGVFGCMWFFSGFCVFCAVFIYAMMPETKGKSIHEIQEILRGKKNYLEIDALRCN